MNKQLCTVSIIAVYWNIELDYLITRPSIFLLFMLKFPSSNSLTNSSVVKKSYLPDFEPFKIFITEIPVIGNF